MGIETQQGGCCWQIHQQMQADNEFNSLIEMQSQELRRQKAARQTGRQQQTHSACLIAVCPVNGSIPELDERLTLDVEAVIGTLDLHGAQAPPGQVLIGAVLADTQRPCNVPTSVPGM